MAKQTGDIKLSGKLGNLIHYQRGAKHFTKTASAGKHKFSAGSLAAQQSFGLGSTVGKQLKFALKPLLDTYQYQGIHNHLTEACKKIFRAGPIHQKDSTRFIDHRINLLIGLNLNKYTSFGSLVRNNPMRLHYETNGLVTLSIAQHNPTVCFFRNPKTYAIAIQFLFSIIDLETSEVNHLLVPELMIPLHQDFFQKKEGTIKLPPLENKLLLSTVQVKYYSDSQCRQHSANRKLVAAEIVHVAYLEGGQFVDYQATEEQKIQQKKSENLTVPITWK